tara:strand:+ start:1043 stop:1882 length:840 start_codon:yes stop_codon:yes gene_type:complete
MRIALCLFGYPKGSTIYAGGAYEQKFKHLFEQVMVHNPDVFIHSWDTSLEEELVNLFEPKLFVFEEQIGFDDEISKLNDARFSPSSKYSPPSLDNRGRFRTGDIFKTWSFFHTRNESNKLKKQYEQDNDFVYDCVVTSRFDVGYHNYGKNKTSYIKFVPTLDMNCIYSAYWRQINAGLSDHWFYGNSSNIDIVCDIRNNVLDYLKKDSEYCNVMMNGWIDSSAEKEFSNEFLQKYKSSLPVMYPEHYCLNNHCLYKWHFYKNNLWKRDACKFLNEELWK